MTEGTGVMRSAAVLALILLTAFRGARADSFDGFQDDILDLGGRSVTVAEISQKEWNSLKTVVSNGTLRVTEKYSTHGGLTSVGPGATLAIGPGAKLSTGQGDAAIRRIVLDSGACLRLENVDWSMDHTTVSVASGAEWFADLAKLTLAGSMKDNRWEISGRAVFPHGIDVAKSDWGCELTVVLKPGGELWLGGPVAFGGKNGALKIVLEGGTLGLFWDAGIAAGLVRLADGAEVTAVRTKGVDFDAAVVEVPDGASLTVRETAEPPIDLPPRYVFETHVDKLNRCYYISADHFKDRVKALAFTYPNPDAESAVKTAVERPTDTLFRKRFPAGEGPWTVHAEIVDIYGDTYRTNIVVRKRTDPKSAPAPNDLVLVGLCGYNEATDLMRGIFEEDLCNLIVGWDTAAKALPEKWPEADRATWAQLVKDRRMWSMSIYSGDSATTQAKLDEAYEGRYLGNNVGEYASYLYQGDGSRPSSVPNDRNLLDAKNHFVNRYVHAAPTGWQGNFPYVFSTCGAALSCYELAGGIDFICNEQWAIGAQNIGHTSAEARGAARKWGPEYWCAWNAHEWQTCALPYLTDQKFDSCLVGYLLEYVSGTSIIVLESGTQGTQADEHTALYPGQPKEERQKQGYDGEVARRYRAVTKGFYDWVKANPRDRGAPETKIAMALGNLDAYLGTGGGYAVWAQHANAATNRLWKYGAPEETQGLLKDIFFPISPKAVDPYKNTWLGGTPYGQVDVFNVDDETTLADLRRYDLLVFGGWNTMMPLERDVLERYVENGGTLVMSRPELTTRVDRDYVGYTDADLDPLFGFLPPEGSPGEYVEKRVGEGRYFLFTAHGFPSETSAGKTAYETLVRTLAGGVRQTVRIDGDAESLASVAYGVYPKKIYFLNADTRSPHTFTWTSDEADDGRADSPGSPRTQTLTLQPCEIKIVDRAANEPPDPWHVGSQDADAIVASTNGTGTLFVRGAGAMRSFMSFAETPWASAAPSIRALKIDSAITDVPFAAFSGLTALETINGAAVADIEAITGPLERLIIQKTSDTILIDMKAILIAAAAVCAATTSLAEGVISINMAGSFSGTKVSDLSGTVPGLSGVEGVTASSWNDIVDKESTEPLALKAWDAAQGKTVWPAGLTAVWSVSGIWHIDSSDDVFRRAYCNSAGSGGGSVTVTGIPFRKYDVVCYCNYDSTPGYGWGPLRLNDTNWTCGEDGVGVQGSSNWGTTVNDASDPAIFGQNAMRINGLSGSELKISNGSPWCNYSAIQIVDATGFLIEAKGDVAASEINAAAGACERVWLVLPEGARLTLDEPLDCTSLTVESEGDITLRAPCEPTAEESAKIDLSRVRGNAYRCWKNRKTIAINFASGVHKVEGSTGIVSSLADGEVPAAGWTDISEKTGTNVVLKLWNCVTRAVETPSNLTATWKISGLSDSGASPDLIRRAWCDSARFGGWSIDISGIPFAKYDLVFYCNYSDSPGWGWGPFTVNGQKWTCGEDGIGIKGDGGWGNTAGTAGDPCAFGQNAMRVNGVTGSELKLANGSAWCNCCAIEIVDCTDYNDYADVIAEGDITTKEINRQMKDRKDVYLTVPAGATLSISKSALRCEKLFVRSAGDLVIDTDYDPADPKRADIFNANMAKLDFTHVAGYVYHGWKPTGGVISFNFGSKDGAMATQEGFAGGLAGEEIPAASWNDLADNDGTNETAKIWKGATHEIKADVRAEWTSHGYYHAGSSPDLYRRGYCNTSGWGGWTLKVENIPFETYDVICTCNFDGTHQFSALRVNGTKWTCGADGIGVTGSADWGRTDGCDKDDPVTLGQNAFRIRGLSGSTLELGSGGAYCNCSAIQIVEPAPERHYVVNGFSVLVK